MKPQVIQQIEDLLKSEIQETKEAQAIYNARTGPLSGWGKEIQGTYLCDKKGNVIGLNLADNEELDELEDFEDFPDLPDLQILNLSQTETYYHTSDYRHFKHEHRIYLDIKPYLARLPKLHTFIHIGNKRLRCGCFFPHLPQLKHLYLNFNGIVYLDWLEQLENLESLDLRANLINHIIPLTSLKNLKHLYLASPSKYKRKNRVKDLSILKELTKLETLSLDLNHVESLTPLQSLYNLKYLRLNEMPKLSPDDFTVIKYLTNLKELSLNDNNLSDIDFLSELKQLEILNLKGNQIKDISILKSLRNLKKLNLDAASLNSPPIWYIYLSIKEGNLGDYLHLSEPPNIKKIWALLRSKDQANIALATALAKGQGWSEDTIKVYNQFVKML